MQIDGLIVFHSGGAVKPKIVFYSPKQISHQNFWSNGKRPIFPIDLSDKYMNFQCI